MPIEFPQQLFLVDGVATFARDVGIRGGVLELCVFFLFGHGRMEKRKRAEGTSGVVFH